MQGAGGDRPLAAIQRHHLRPDPRNVAEPDDILDPPQLLELRQRDRRAAVHCRTDRSVQAQDQPLASSRWKQVVD